MKKYVFLLFFVFSASTNAYAMFIVNTGAGTGVDGQILDETISHAAKFTLDDAYRLSDLEVWILSKNDTFELSIYGDSGEIPSDDVFFRDNFTVKLDRVYAWDGLNNQSIDLSAGSYWLGVRGVGNIGGGLQKGVPNPQADEAYKTTRINYPVGWQEFDDANTGWRIQGEILPQSTTPVPEPSTFLVFFSGCVGALVKKKLFC